MQRIVVPTDFSIKSYNALELAKKVAKKSSGTIHLIHVIEPLHGQYTSIGELMEKGFNDEYTRKLTKIAKEELSGLKHAHEDRTCNINTDILVGNPFLKIKEFVKRQKADLVVMGAKGVTDTDEFFLGSLSDKVVRSIEVPVIIVKVVADKDEFENIVYATDLEEEHPAVMNQLIKFQALFQSTLHIVKINTQKKFRNDIDSMVELHRLADKYHLKDYTLNCYSHEDEEYGVVYFADEKKANLIAMGIHEKSGIRRLISGGALADEVTEHTFRPVLTCRLQTGKA